MVKSCSLGRYTRKDLNGFMHFILNRISIFLPKSFLSTVPTCMRG